MSDEFNLKTRGLLLIVDELKVFGNPPQRIKVWATLHFLPAGSPFCCAQPECHLPQSGNHLGRLNDALRRRLELTQPISLEFALAGNSTHAGIKFEPP